MVADMLSAYYSCGCNSKELFQNLKIALWIFIAMLSQKVEKEAADRIDAALFEKTGS